VARWRKPAAVMVGASVLLLPACTQDGYVDSCGNSHEGRESTVFGVEAATGDLMWEVRAPEHDSVLLRAGEGQVRVPTSASDHDTVLDVQTGAVVSTPDARRPAVTAYINSGGSGQIQGGDLVVDGEVQPMVVKSGDLEIQTDVWSTRDDVQLHADGPTGQVWSVLLAPKDGASSISRPLLIGHVVVVATRDSHPGDRLCG
jgi:hypothetical protein